MVADLCNVVLSRKPTKWWHFRVFAWRPLAPPHESTFYALRFRLLFVVSLPGGAKGRHAKPAKITIWRVFAWRPFAFSPLFILFKLWFGRIFAWRPFAPPGKDTTNRGESAKGRHAKTRQMLTFSCFRMATFRPATRKNATFHALRFRLLFVVSLPGEAKGRHAKTRQNPI